ncbi:MAG: nucleotidyltransferase [Spirochaetes bacterium]|nr:nucleotidyltransferase [Spirochaetota bacterium]
MTSLHFSQDIIDFLSALSRHDVKYVIVGGGAVIYYGYPRLTGDMDIFYDPEEDNSHGLYNALNDFWDNSIPGIESYHELMEENVIIQFGTPPNRIDLLNHISGVTFPEAWKSHVEEKIDSKGHMISINYISLENLIKNKQAIRRNKDMDDLKYLESIK